MGNIDDMATKKFKSLIELFDYRAEKDGRQQAYSFLRRGKEEAALNYAELQSRSRAIAVALQNKVARGERALLMYSPGLDFITGFLGCLYAGVIAVPAYPPSLARPERHLPRLRSIAASAEIAIILTTETVSETLSTTLRGASELANKLRLATDTIDVMLSKSWHGQASSPDTLALLQYTSGSTATPKGVMVTHGNLLHNLRFINECERNDRHSVGLSWLPAYHDMGLVEGILLPAYGGYPGYLMAPNAFIQRPARWLQAISRYGVSNSGGPDFAYRYCVQKITQQERQGIDLTSWRVAYNGSEPVQLDTIKEFSETFLECGFKPEALSPVYGLAESTVLVSASPMDSLPSFKRLDLKMLSRHKVKEISTNQGLGTTVISCGLGDPEASILIVDIVKHSRCAPNEEGEIWISGPSVAQGYWNNLEDTQRTFDAYLADTKEGPYLRTGDLGFIAEGNLYITGRIKDIIIIRGRKLYPQDIEGIVETCHPRIHQHGVAAFSVAEISGERLVVMAELDTRPPGERDKQRARLPSTSQYLCQDIMGDIVESVSERYETAVSEVLLVPRGHVCKTSSGKVQRFACKQNYLIGKLAVLARWQSKQVLRALRNTQDYKSA